LSGATRQGRKGAAQKLAAGLARPDPKARPVTVERLQAVFGNPEMNETDAQELIDRLFALGDVVVQAFKEQQSRASESFAEAELVAVTNTLLTPTAPPA
jgi:hypothetical protein